MVEYAEIASSYWSSSLVLDEVVLIGAVSDETLQMPVRWEKGLEGIVVVFRWWMFRIPAYRLYHERL
jgi:hypothetical protein